jgi:hypothetical protein
MEFKIHLNQVFFIVTNHYSILAIIEFFSRILLFFEEYLSDDYVRRISSTKSSLSVIEHAISYYVHSSLIKPQTLLIR